MLVFGCNSFAGKGPTHAAILRLSRRASLCRVSCGSLRQLRRLFRQLLEKNSAGQVRAVDAYVFYQCRTVVDEDTDSYAQVLGCLGGAVRDIDVFPKPIRDAVRRAVLTEYGEDVDTLGDLLKGFAERAKTTE